MPLSYADLSHATQEFLLGDLSMWLGVEETQFNFTSYVPQEKEEVKFAVGFVTFEVLNSGSLSVSEVTKLLK